MTGDASASKLAIFRTAEGLIAVEVPRGVLPGSAVVDAAKEAAADLLWVQTPAVDPAMGFRRRGSYARFEAPTGPAPVELARPPREQVRELERACFAGVWGHHDPGEPDPDAVYVGLYERGAWVGVCEADPADRWIVGPGVLPGFRSPDRYARLVSGAAGALGPGPVRLETWGHDDATLLAYQHLGFQLVDYMPAWELDLRNAVEAQASPRR